MYIALFNSYCQNLGLVTNVTVDFTKRVYDMDNFQASGYCTQNIKGAVFFTLNEDDGKQIYSAFVKDLIPKNNTLEIIGRDFRELHNTEILLDFLNSYPAFLEDLFNLIGNQLISNPDVIIKSIPFSISSLPYGSITVPLKDLSWTLQRTLTNTFEFKIWVDYIVDSSATISNFTRINDSSDSRHWNYSGGDLYLYVEKTNINSYGGGVTGLKAYLAATYTNGNFKHGINQKLLFGDRGGTFVPSGVYSFMLPFLKYYGIVLDTSFDWVTKSIKFQYIKDRTTHKIKLKDFKHEQTKSETQTNKTIARIQWKEYEFQDTSKFPEVVKDWYKESPGNDWVKTGQERYKSTEKYYYLTTDNQIVESNNVGNISNRVYPVITKYFIEEYLAEAQYKAVMELANSRYTDSIYIDDSILNPLDIKNWKLNDLVDIYDENSFYKQLPISEIQLKVDSKGVKRRYKLGFKKDKLTEIIKKL